MSSLDDELAAMARAERAARTAARGYGINIRAYRQFFPDKAAAAKETPKVNGVSLNSDGTVTVNGTRYTRDEFRGALELNIKAQREDPNSAYRNTRDPNHKQAVKEINLAYRWLGGELTESDEREIVTEWHEATQESSEVTDALLPHQEIAQIVGTPEGRVALQRARTGQPLDARQAAIVKRHDELEAANNTVARKEQASRGGWMKTTRPHSIPTELHAIERIADVRERTHAIRQQKAAWRDDPKSPFNDASHPEHKNYVEAMSRLYQAEADLGPQPEDEK
jgi:hypothetical protein